MKAIVCEAYGTPDVLKATKLQQPIPADNEVLIKVEASSVSMADHRLRSLDIPQPFKFLARLALGFNKPKQSILGMEIAGEVVQTGNHVTRFKTGDRVFAAMLNQLGGGYAQYATVKADGPIALAPTNIPLSYAAALPIGARTAIHYLRRSGAKMGDHLLVYGASGSVGIYTLQFAKYLGLQVTAVCSGINTALVKTHGADNVIDYTSPEYEKSLGLYDHIFEVIEAPGYKNLRLHLRAGGCYMNATSPLPTFLFLWDHAFKRVRSVLGEKPPESCEMMEELRSLVEKGLITPVIDQEFNFDQIVAAHSYVDLGHKRGNVIVKW